MGLFDSPGAAEFLLQAGLGLMASGQPQPMGVNRYAPAIQGIQSGITSRHQALALDQNEQYRKAQMEQMAQATAEKDRTRIAQQRLANYPKMGANGPRANPGPGVTGVQPSGFFHDANLQGMLIDAGYGEQVASALMRPPEKADQPPAGYRKNPDGTMAFIPGGPADPTHAGQLAAATRTPVQPPKTLAQIEAEAKASATGTAAGRPVQEGGPFAGTSIDGQSLNYLIKGDPKSDEYAAAYAHYAMPKVSIDPNTGAITTIKPDMSMFRQPVRSQAPAAPAAPAPTAPPTQAAQAPGLMTPPAAPTTAGLPGPEITTTPGAAPRKEYNKSVEGASTIVGALLDFRDTRKKSSLMDKGKSAFGGTTPLNTSYNIAALMAKGEELFQLGVLNGPDLEIIQKTLPDPSTFKGAAANDADTDVAVDKVIDIIQSRLSAKTKQMGLPEVNIREYAKSTRPKAAENAAVPPPPPGFTVY